MLCTGTTAEQHCKQTLGIVDDSAEKFDGVAVQHLLAETQGFDRQIAGGLQRSSIGPVPIHSRM